jgi:hypothetical protein
MSNSKLVANAAAIDPAISDKVARAWRLQVLLLMGSGVVAAAQIGKAIIAVPMIRSDLAALRQDRPFAKRMFRAIGMRAAPTASLAAFISTGHLLSREDGRSHAPCCALDLFEGQGFDLSHALAGNGQLTP